MCLGIPGRITTIFEEEGIRMGKVDFSGVLRRVCLAYLPDAREGDYTIVHAGFAISRVDEAEAQRTLALLDEMETSAAPEDS
jgi:hydrogenase expression/formation protein HypC